MLGIKLMKTERDRDIRGRLGGIVLRMIRKVLAYL